MALLILFIVSKQRKTLVRYSILNRSLNVWRSSRLFFFLNSFLIRIFVSIGIPSSNFFEYFLNSPSVLSAPFDHVTSGERIGTQNANAKAPEVLYHRHETSYVRTTPRYRKVRVHLLNCKLYGYTYLIDPYV